MFPKLVVLMAGFFIFVKEIDHGAGVIHGQSIGSRALLSAGCLTPKDRIHNVDGFRGP